MRFTPSPRRPRSFESVRQMFTAPQDERWAGVPQSVRTVSTVRVLESQRRQGI